jgi:hypothetical protein
MSLTKGSNLVFDCLFVTEDPAYGGILRLKNISRKGAKEQRRKDFLAVPIELLLAI